MFSGAAKAIQPVKIVGTLRHMALWVRASSGDVIYRNPNYKESKDENNEIVIYCVHGTADRSSAFSLVAERLLKSNYFPERISAIHMLSFEKRGKGESIKEFSEQLKTKIQTNKHKNVILMGHSRGGLVVSYFSEYLAKSIDVNVHGIMTICSPFGGSSFAIKPVALFSTSVGEMAKGSPFLTGLAEQVRKSSIPYFYFAVSNDYLVPPDLAYVTGRNASLVVLDIHDHLSIMASGRLVELLLSCLDTAMCNLKHKDDKSLEVKI